MPHHGGDLAHAKGLVVDPVDAGAHWVDLSTGINPATYEIGPVPAEIWNRLPDAALDATCLGAAREYYRVPAELDIVAGAGSQILLACLPALLGVKRVQIVGPTYGGHGTSWRAQGCAVSQIARLEDADPAGVVIVVRPNNPTGYSGSLRGFLAHAVLAKKAGGMVIVDEAFGDCLPNDCVAPHMAGLPILVLKSVGKFFGLAGMRLGFAIGAPEFVEKIRSGLGDWPVSGPALYGGARALADGDWQWHMRAALAEKRVRLDQALSLVCGEVVGEASLFALLETTQAPALFAHLLRHHIYVRAFDYDACWLRFGLPKDDAEFARLETALRQFEGG